MGDERRRDGRAAGAFGITAAHLLFLSAFGWADAAAARPQAESIANELVTIRVEQQYAAVRPGSESVLALNFELAKDWHFYASAENAPGQMNLKVKPSAGPGITFGDPVFPASETYFDPSSGKTVDVFSGTFRVFIPFRVAPDAPAGRSEPVSIAIEGAVCSDVQCRVPDFGSLAISVKIDARAAMERPAFVLPGPTASPAPRASPRPASSYSFWFALVLALLAGLSLNVMPCVWPVIPIIVMRLVDQSKAGGSRATALGLAFACGILSFFACLAAANIVLRLAFGTVLQWGDQFRHPAFLGAMAVLLVVMAMFSFGVLTLSVPASLGGGAGTGRGLAGSAGMGFLAALLSTPCSFAILAAAFAWAQGQSLGFSTLAIMLIGAGMAAPYAVLTAVPAWLRKMPRPGHWMEIFKKSIGFVMLLIAVKLISALPQAGRMNMVYFGVALAFCLWMWGGWVGIDTKPRRKWAVRGLAVVLAAAAAWAFLAPSGKPFIDWRGYDAAAIEKAVAEKRPVLIDFTADWCLSCAVVERRVYARKDIAALIKEKGVLAVKADTTRKDSPATAALGRVYGEPGVPVTILYLPGEPVPLRWRGLSFGDELAAALRKLPPQ